MRFWFIPYRIRHPVRTYMWCGNGGGAQLSATGWKTAGYEIHTVVGFIGGDENILLFEDGSSASWMDCCNPVGE